VVILVTQIVFFLEKTHRKMYGLITSIPVFESGGGVKQLRQWEKSFREWKMWIRMLISLNEVLIGKIKV
jgi:hypothetical protein